MPPLLACASGRSPLRALALTAALAGCNAAPIAPVIQLSPNAPTTVDALELTFLTRSDDPNGADAVAYAIRWSVDGQPAADLDDTLVVDHRRTVKGQVWTAVVTPRDTRGLEGQGSAATATVRNTPPTAQVVIEPLDPQPGQPLRALPTGADVDGDPLTWRYRWSLDDVETEYEGQELPADLTNKGELWTVSAWPFDGDDEGEPAQATISIDNGRPIGVAVVIEPDTAFTDTLLTAIPEGFDEDGDVLTWAFTWFVEGEPVPAVSGPELTGDHFEKGFRVVVEATPNDGFVDGNAVRSQAIRIQNTPPTVAAAAILPDEAFKSTTLSCVGSGYFDLDGDPEGYRYSWIVDGVPGGAGPTLDGTAFRKGQSVVCELTAFDGQSEGDTVRSDGVRILNTAPAIDAVTIDNPAPKAGDTLAARITGARDDDGDPLTYLYRWTADGALVGTSPTLSSSAFRRGQAVRVQVTPFDGEAEGEPVTSPAVTILNTAPVMTGVGLGPDPAYTYDTVVATPTATDADDDALSYRYAWTVNGSAAGGSTATLASSNFIRGDQVRVTVTPTDGDLDGAPLVSGALTIRNAIPAIDRVVIDPSDLGADDDARCVPSGWTDADDDPESYRFAWEVNGDLVAETEVLTSFDYVRGDLLVCVATPFDGRDEGEPVRSAAVTIRNTVPELDAVTLSTDAPREGDTVFATVAGAYDADGDPVSFKYAWYVNGSVVATTETLSSSLFAKGDTIRVEITPTDGFGDGDAVSSETITVANTAPVVASVTLAPTSPRTTDGVTATVVATDADAADTLTYRYTWTIDGATSSETGATLPASAFVKNQSIQVTVIATDGDDDSAPLTSSTVVSVNTPPAITSVSISPSTDIVAESTLTCVPAGWTDADADTEGYRWAWTIDGEIVGSSATLSGAFRKGNSITCTATPFDGEAEGTARTSAAVAVGNTAPELASAAISPSSPATTDTLSVTLGAATDADGDTVSFKYAWYVGSAMVSSAATLSPSLTARGQVVYAVVTPNDGTDDGDPITTATVTIANTAPVVSALSLSPTSPRTLDTITASATATDADGDSVSLTYTWFVNGSDVGASGAALAGSFFEKGDTVRVEVVPSDGTASGAKVVSSTLTVLNTAPSISSVALSPSSLAAGVDVTCVPSGWSDADGDAAGYRYAWTVDGAALSDTGATLAASKFGRGSTVRCTVTPDDGEDTGAPVSSAVATVANTPPTLDDVSITPTDPTRASTLTAVLGDYDDPDGDTVSFRYSWRVGSTVVGTGATLSAAGLAKGSVVSVIVTPTDGTDDGEPVTSASVTIGNTAPVVSAVGLTPSPIRTAGTLTATVTASDLDGDALSFSYTWYVGGAVVAETSRSLPGSYFERDDEVYVVVTANDGTASSAEFTSASVVVANTAPTLTGATLSPSSVTTTTEVTCTPFGWSDADGDAASYRYRWTVAGSTVDGETTSKLGGDQFSKGQSVQCHVTPWDGIDEGAAVSSEAVTVANTAPVVSAVSLSPTSPRVANTVTVAITASDADGDAISYTYAWTINGATIGHSGSTLTSAHFKKNDTIRVTVTPSDGSAAGAAVSSSTITAINTAPVISSLVLSPNPAYTNTSLTATVAASDADGDSLSYVYGWYVNGTKQGSTSSVLASSAFVKGNSVYAEVTALDGDTSTGPFTSAAITIANSAPTAPGSIDLTPSAPKDTDDLSCSVGTVSTDVDDGDTISYQFEYYRNGTLVGPYSVSSTTHTLSASATAGGQNWYCRARAFDGSSYSAWSSNSPTRTVELPATKEIYFTRSTYWVLPPDGTPASDHASVCGAHGLKATGSYHTVPGGWSRELYEEITLGLGFELMATGCCVEAMWCYTGTRKCWTHNNSSTRFYNWGWASSLGQGVFSCVE